MLYMHLTKDMEHVNLCGILWYIYTCRSFSCAPSRLWNSLLFKLCLYVQLLKSSKMQISVIFTACCCMGWLKITFKIIFH
jgi:hypothetical protein